MIDPLDRRDARRRRPTPDQYGDIVTVSIPGAIGRPSLPDRGHGGDRNDVFSVGAYAVQVGFTGGTPVDSPAPTPTPRSDRPVTPAPTQPRLPLPSSPTTPAPDDRARPVRAAITPSPRPRNSAPGAAGFVTNLTIPTGKDIRVFTFEAAAAGTVLVASANTTLIVGDVDGPADRLGHGADRVPWPRRRGPVTSWSSSRPTAPPIANYGFAIDVDPRPGDDRRRSRRSRRRSR